MTEETQCCPKFDPSGWDDKLFEWSDKKFIKARVKTFMFMPIGFGKVIAKLQEMADKSGVSVPDYLCLSDHTSKWNMDIYLAVDKEVEGAENVTLSGKYYSKVYEGDFKDTGKWTEDFKIASESKGYKPKKWYMWYTTCPKCAKKYGKNYVVILAEI